MKFLPAFITLLLPLFAFAFDNSPKCFLEIEKNFFTYDLTARALSLQRISESQWTQITNKLEQKSSGIHNEVANRASKLRPDPLQYPFKPGSAFDVLYDVLYDVFADTLKDYNVTNSDMVRQMFDYIKRGNQSRIQTCSSRSPD